MSESDVRRRRILTYKDGPRTERNIIYTDRRYISIQMNRKELTKTFMLISNCLCKVYANIV